MGKHALLSPSSAERWVNCPGSVALIEQLRSDGILPLEDPSSEDAEEGTHAHAALEHCLGSWVDPVTVVGEHFYDRVLTMETALAVKVCYDYVNGWRQKAAETGHEIKIWSERRVTPKTVNPVHCEGTLDISILHPQNTLEIIDYKHGKGVFVPVEDNRQLQLYLLGAQEDTPEANISMGGLTTIIQPRCPDRDGQVIRTHGYTAEDVDFLNKELMAAASRALTFDTAPRVPGEEQCRWCPAKSHCPEAAQANLGVILQPDPTQIFSPIPQGQELATRIEQTITQGPKLDHLTVEQITAILDNEEAIRGWLKAIHRWAHDKVLSGEMTIPGWIMGSGDTHRKWDFGSDEETVDYLRERKVEGNLRKLGYDVVSNRKPLSPAQAENIIKPQVSEATWKNISKHITKPTGAPVLVRDDGSRKPLAPKAESVFEPIGQEQAPALPAFFD